MFSCQFLYHHANMCMEVNYQYLCDGKDKLFNFLFIHCLMWMDESGRKKVCKVVLELPTPRKCSYEGFFPFLGC